MFCPLSDKGSYEEESEFNECYTVNCAWWDSKANYNHETKQYEGQCCILTLSRLKISGGISTRGY